jgi:hypothetical protein
MEYDIDGQNLKAEETPVAVVLCLGCGAANTVDRLSRPSKFTALRLDGIKIASTHGEPIASVKEGQYVTGRRRGGVIRVIKVPFRSS